MTPLLVVVPYCQKDAALAKELVSWIAELKTPRAAAILLVADNTVPRDVVTEISEIAKKTFSFVKTALVPVSPGGWPPNKMFLAATNQINEQYRWPFLWLEPDAIPLTPTWLEELENAYHDCPKKFMGAIIKQDSNPALPKEHLTGCSIYPPEAHRLFRTLEEVNSGKSAWDIAGAAKVVPRTMHTDLIFHFWGQPDLPPTFVVRKEPGREYPRNTFELSKIPTGAVIMHRNKDGTLIKCLREITATTQPVQPQPTPTPSAQVPIGLGSTIPSPQKPIPANK